MRFIALLRGINVGGKSRVEMSRLKALFEGLGYTDVRTYINSGNVVFTAEGTPDVQRIERGIEQEFGFFVGVIVLSAAAFRSIAESIESTWQNDSEQRTDVLFLWPVVDDESVLEKVSFNPDIEIARYVPGALIWNIRREFVRKGGAIKLINTDIYKHMTVRNCNTVRKLASFLD